MSRNRIKKTNALRLIDGKGVEYIVHTYDTGDGHNDGISVANKIGKPADAVYKTLVCMDSNGGHCVFVIPVERELDLKKAAKAANAKKIEMLPQKQLLAVTGYVKGGCSPLGMKKPLPTWFDESVISRETVIVSAGSPGLQMELSALDLVDAAGAGTADLCVN